MPGRPLAALGAPPPPPLACCCCGCFLGRVAGAEAESLTRSPRLEEAEGTSPEEPCLGFA